MSIEMADWVPFEQGSDSNCKYELDPTVIEPST